MYMQLSTLLCINNAVINVIFFNCLFHEILYWINKLFDILNSGLDSETDIMPVLCDSDRT